jgi:hypothetical protein
MVARFRGRWKLGEMLGLHHRHQTADECRPAELEASGDEHHRISEPSGPRLPMLEDAQGLQQRRRLAAEHKDPPDSSLWRYHPADLPLLTKPSVMAQEVRVRARATRLSYRKPAMSRLASRLSIPRQRPAWVAANMPCVQMMPI